MEVGKKEKSSVLSSCELYELQNQLAGQYVPTSAIVTWLLWV